MNGKNDFCIIDLDSQRTLFDKNTNVEEKRKSLEISSFYSSQPLFSTSYISHFMLFCAMQLLYIKFCPISLQFQFGLCIFAARIR